LVSKKIHSRDRRIKSYIKNFFGFVNPNFIKLVIDSNHNLVAFAITIPSLSRALQMNKGKLLPFGFIPLLWAIHHSKVLDLYLIAVKSKYQGKGVNAMLINSLMNTAKAYGITHAESGPELEDNEKVQSQWKLFQTRQHRRRRSWIKNLG
jgi:GNAT superfamily N-acetyltransferase